MQEHGEADEARIAARLAKLMAMICVRNTRIEGNHPVCTAAILH